MGVKETVEGKQEDEQDDKSLTEDQDSEEKDKTDDEEEKEDDLSDEDKKEQQEALQLYRNLTGSKGADYLSQLAKTQGLELVGTKQEKKEVAKSIAETFKGHLGTDFEFFSEKIGAAMEEIINDRLLPEVESAKSTAVGNQVATHLKDIFEEESIPTSEREAIQVLMDKMSIELPYGKGSLKTYIKRLYKVTMSEDSKSRKRLERIRRNAEEDDGISADVPPTFRVVKGPKNPTLHDAIAAAARGEKWE